MAPLPGEEDEGFETLGGFVVDRFGYIPKTGEHFAWNDWRFEVVDMDRHRVDKVLLGRHSPAPQPGIGGPAR